MRSTLSARLIKLESLLTDTEPMRIANFIVSPGNLDPIGYRCHGVEIMREPGESTEALRKRCGEAVLWLDGNCRNIFEPLEECVHH
jgi:hypothetical protein